MKRPGEPRGIYKALKIERIDLVDRGASFDAASGEGAHVTIVKRDTSWATDVAKSVLSAATRNKLPNSSFAVVDANGDGHLPYKHADGSIDLPHLRNALARLNQTQLSPEDKAKAKRKLEAAAREHLPSHQAEKMADDTENNEAMDEDEQDEKTPKAKKAAAKKVDETAVTKAEEKLAAEVAKREALEAMVTKMRDERDREVFIRKAESYPAFGAKETLGEILHLCSKALSKEQFTHLTDRLGAVSKALTESKLMAELGGTEGADEAPDAKIQKMAVEIRKSNPSLTNEQAYAEALSTPEGSQIYASWKRGA